MIKSIKLVNPILIRESKPKLFRVEYTSKEWKGIQEVVGEDIGNVQKTRVRQEKKELKKKIKCCFLSTYKINWLQMKDNIRSIGSIKSQKINEQIIILRNLKYLNRIQICANCANFRN